MASPHPIIVSRLGKQDICRAGRPLRVLRLLAAEGMVSLGIISLDGTKLAGNAAQKANRTLPQIEKLLAEAAKVDAAEDARLGDVRDEPTPRALARGLSGGSGWPRPGPAGGRGPGTP